MALISKLENIGNAIREKTGKEDKLTLDEMAVEIAAIETGGGSAELPEEAFKITGDCTYRFSFNGWNWFINTYGNKITTENITNIDHLFQNCNTLTEIPFDINISNNCKALTNVFHMSTKLTNLPLIKGTLSAPTGNYSGVANMNYFFNACQYVRNIPYDYFHNFGGDAFWEASKNYKGTRGYMFAYCFSLRQLPDISMLKITDTSPYGVLYYNGFTECYALDEIVNLPVLDTCTFTSNAFYNTFDKCSRVKNITFETNEDGTPISVNWKSQTIDLSKYVGFAYRNSEIVNYNSGITSNSVPNIENDDLYQSYKDNPDYWTTKEPYSRYNHDSAIETINSLPITTNTGCVIKFKGIAGASTDGGAISTLTEEEIAVAAAKGWTVTLV